jgi:hypothetical protein
MVVIVESVNYYYLCNRSIRKVDESSLMDCLKDEDLSFVNSLRYLLYSELFYQPDKARSVSEYEQEDKTILNDRCIFFTKKHRKLFFALIKKLR